MRRALALLCLCSVACGDKAEAPKFGGRDSNTPLHPLAQAAEAGRARTCWNDSECDGAFSHCAKDRPEDLGICTRACATQAECTAQSHWRCELGVWNRASDTMKTMCRLTCESDATCPRGTSCNDGYCGTPCQGPNCDCGAAMRQCDADGHVVISDACGTRSAETCAQGCAGGLCK